MFLLSVETDAGAAAGVPLCMCSVLAVARGALGLRLDRRFVELLLEAFVEGPWYRPSLSSALNCLHILLRPHPLLRVQHAMATATCAENFSDGNDDFRTRARDPRPLVEVFQAQRPSLHATTTAAGVCQETQQQLRFAFEEADEAEAPQDRTARLERQEAMLQHFVLPPLERALELPWGLAEAPLFPAWKLQRLRGVGKDLSTQTQRQLLGQEQSLQLGHFAARNAEFAADTVAAPLHALDLLFLKFSLCWNLPWKTAIALEAPRVQQIRAVLDAFNAASEMLAWDEELNGPLESEEGGVSAISKQSGQQPTTQRDGTIAAGCAAHVGGDATLSSSADLESLAAAAKRLALTAPLGGTSSLGASWVGEVTLGSVALLQHGRLEGAFSHPDFGTLAAALQRQSLQQLMLQQRNQTRRRLAKIADGPQRAVALSQRLSAFCAAGGSLVSSSWGDLGVKDTAPIDVTKEDAGAAPCKSLSLQQKDGHNGELPLDKMSAVLFSEGCPLTCCGFLSVASTLSLSDEIRISLTARASAALGGGPTRRRGVTGRGLPKNSGKNKGIISTLEGEMKLARVLDILEDVEL